MSNDNIESVKISSLLDTKIKSIKDNAPKDKKQFYLQSFEIFSSFVHTVDTLNTFNNTNDSETLTAITSFMDLSHDYNTTVHLVPIWDLLEKLYTPKNDYSLSLAEWLNNAYPVNDEVGDVWERVQAHLLRGNFEEVIDILTNEVTDLQEHNRAAIDTLIQLIEAFRKIQEVSDQEIIYHQQWKEWKERCHVEFENYINTYSYEQEDSDKMYQSILNLFGILEAEEETLASAGSYFEVIIGHLLFVRPLARLSGINSLAQEISFNDEEKDKVKVICVRLIQSCFDDALDVVGEDIWMQTHLGAVLIGLGVYNTTENSLTTFEDGEVVMDPIYYCIQRYANILVEDYDMWNEAILYLSICSENKQIWVIQLLEHPSIESKTIEELDNIMDTTIELKMIKAERFIHQIKGKKYEHKKDIKKATVEFGRAQDIHSLNRIAHAEFSQYLKTGDLGDVVLDMEDLKLSPHYALLILYHQFKEYLKNKQWKKASRALLSLLKSEHLPIRFETVLLIDNLQILEESAHYYLSDEVIELLNTFKEITKESSNQKFIEKYYSFVKHTTLSSDLITARLRESLAYKAATAPTVF